MTSSQYDILLCSETIVSDMRHVLELLVPGFSCPVLSCRGMMPRTIRMGAYVKDGHGAVRRLKFECGCYEILCFGVCSARQNYYVISFYRNPDLDDRIYDCYLT